MRFDLVYFPEAFADLEEASNWYENCRIGLGDGLIARVKEAAEKIRNFPEHHEEIAPGIRKKMVRQFPYSVVYQIQERRIEILAIYHNHRDPKSWQRRLLGN